MADRQVDTAAYEPVCRKCGEREELNSDDVCFTCWGDLTPWWKSLLWFLRHPRMAHG